MHHTPAACSRGRSISWLMLAGLLLAGGWLGAVRPTEAVVPGDNGLIAFASNRDGDYDIYALTPRGELGKRGTKPRQLTDAPGDDIYPAWSPDGTKIAFERRRDGNIEVYVMGADGGNPTRLTINAAYDGFPAWSPDGRTIAFMSDRDGNLEIYVMDADGGRQKRLTTNAAPDWNPVWSPDGTRLAFHRTREGDDQVYTMRADGTSEKRLTKHGTNNLADWQEKP